MNSRGNEIKVVMAESKKAFEEQVEILMEQGFVFFPESFKVDINYNEGVRNFVIMMFRKCDKK